MDRDRVQRQPNRFARDACRFITTVDTADRDTADITTVDTDTHDASILTLSSRLGQASCRCLVDW